MVDQAKISTHLTAVVYVVPYANCLVLLRTSHKNWSLQTHVQVTDLASVAPVPQQRFLQLQYEAWVRGRLRITSAH